MANADRKVHEPKSITDFIPLLDAAMAAIHPNGAADWDYVFGIDDPMPMDGEVRLTFHLKVYCHEAFPSALAAYLECWGYRRVEIRKLLFRRDECNNGTFLSGTSAIEEWSISFLVPATIGNDLPSPAALPRQEATPAKMVSTEDLKRISAALYLRAATLISETQGMLKSIRLKEAEAEQVFGGAYKNIH